MERNNVIKRMTAFMLIAVMAVAFMPIFGLSDAGAATKKGRLVKAVTKQYYDDTKMKWITEHKVSYAYNKKNDPVKIKTKDYNSDGKLVSTDTCKNVYKYKKSVRRSRKMTVTYSDPDQKLTQTWKYDKYGNPKKSNRYSSYQDEWWINTETNYVYKKRGYLTKESSTWFDNYSDENDPDTGKWKYTVKQKKNLLKSFVAYSYNKNEKKWEKEKAYSFNSKGLVTKVTDYAVDTTMTFKYSWKKGRVTSVTRSVTDEDSSYKDRYKFSYTKKKTGKIRYAKMINQITCDAYTFYPWY